MAKAFSADDAELFFILGAKVNALLEVAHSKMTVRQALFFLAVLNHRGMGETVTMARLRERYPLGRSIEKSKAMFLPPTAKVPDALGWLDQELEPGDARQRPIVVTSRGHAVAARIDAAGNRLTMALIAKRVREARGAP